MDEALQRIRANNAPLDYIVAEEWGDEQWRAIAANPSRSEAEFALYKAGPRRHPYGSLAVEVADGARTLIFPSQDVADAYKAANAPAPAPKGKAVGAAE